MRQKRKMRGMRKRRKAEIACCGVVAKCVREKQLRKKRKRI